MGQFSWFTQDKSHTRIIDGKPMDVYMTDDKGNSYHETCYEGYGVFGGKDYYILLAEMNGYTIDDFDGNERKLRSKGIDLAFENSPIGDNPNVKHPSLSLVPNVYYGEPPICDPNQGWEDDDDDYYYDDDYDDDL